MKKGFTLLEMMIGIGTLGILSTCTVISYKKCIAHDRLQKEANNLYIELRALRPIALKFDTKAIIKILATQCSVYVDTNEDDTRNPNEIYKAFQILDPISISIPSDGPTDGPPGIDFDPSGIAGNWKTTMTIDHDPIGSINSGAIYIMSSQVPKITYCIGISSNTLSLKLYKWSGTWSTIN